MYENLYNFIDAAFGNNPVSAIDDVAQKKLMYQTLFFGTLSSILGNIFDYEGLEAIDEIDLKRCYLFSHYVGYSDSLRKFIPLNPAGSRNFFNEYTEFTSAIGEDTNVKYSVYSDKNIVGFSKSFYTINDAYTCYIYACRLAELVISIDNAVIASRILNIFVGTENQKNELEEMFQRINLGYPFTIKEEFSEESAKVLQLQQPTEINKFYDAYRDIINEFLMVSGLSSLVNPAKKERLLEDEISINKDIKSAILIDKYQNRKAFLDKINAKYGTNYQVKFNVEMKDFEHIMDPEGFRVNAEGQEGGEKDGL